MAKLNVTARPEAAEFWTTAQDRTRYGAVPTPSRQHTDQSSPRVSSIVKRNDSSRQKYLVKPDNAIENRRLSAPLAPSDENQLFGDNYECPPDSPTLAAQNERQKRLAFERSAGTGSGVHSPQATSYHLSGDRKRSSTEMSADSFLTAPQSAKKSKSSEILPQEAQLDQGFISQDSTNRSLHNSFWSQGQDGPSTANTSFVSYAGEITEPKNLLERPKLFHTSGTLSIEDNDMRLQTDSVERQLRVTEDLSAYIAIGKQIDDEPLSQPMEELHLDDREQNASPHRPEATPGGPEHYLVRDFPMQGLFCEDTPPTLAPQHFFARHEACRVALRTGFPVSMLLNGYTGSFKDYDCLWSHFETVALDRKLPKRADPKAWNAATTGSSEVILVGSLVFNTEKSGALFYLRLEPVQSEKSCRFQRFFGPDRFLYLNVPSFRSRPKALNHLAGQDHHFVSRYRQFLRKEHRFLGRTWSVLMVENKQSKKTVRQRNPESSQRLILFATEGLDVRPRPNCWTEGNILISS